MSHSLFGHGDVSSHHDSLSRPCAVSPGISTLLPFYKDAAEKMCNQRKSSSRTDQKKLGGFDVKRCGLPSDFDPVDAARCLSPGEASKFAFEFIQAHDMLQESWSLLGQDLGCRSDDAIVKDSVLVRSCALILQASALTDCRAAMRGEHLKLVPTLELAFHVTLDLCLDQPTQLRELTPAHFIILLCMAFGASLQGPRMFARRLVHELVKHIPRRGDAAHGVSARNLWGEEMLRDSHMYAGMDVNDLSFSLATLGIKINRYLYQKWPRGAVTGSHLEGFHGPEDLSQETLLDAIEFFAVLQLEAKPSSPVGHMNLAYVADEKGMAAEAVSHFRRAVIYADAAENDIVSATARIQLGGCLIFGADPHPEAGSGWVARKPILRMYQEAMEKKKALKKWHMEIFVSGESSCEDVVRVFLERTSDMPKGASATRTYQKPNTGPDRGSDALFEKHKCESCGKHFLKTMLCSGCKSVRYCGKSCQNNGWKIHKKECAQLARLSAE